MTVLQAVDIEIGVDDSKLKRGLNSASREVDGFSRDASRSIVSAGNRMTLGFTAPIVAAGGFAVKQAIDIESAFAGVRKTIDANETELALLNSGLVDLATGDSPVSALEGGLTEIYGIAEAAGQLGVAQDDIVAFTETIAALGMTTDITGEQGAIMVAQFANVSGMPLSEVGNFGDAIATLGNNSATTESAILGMSSRIASLGQFGFSTDELLGYSAALASAGISAELGGSNFTKAVKEMDAAAREGGPGLQLMADTAGMTATEFQNMMSNDPSDAVQSFITGLGQLDAGDQIAALNELGLTGTEMQSVMMALTGDTDRLAESLDTAALGFAGNNALMSEAEVRAQTTQGQINRLRNNFITMSGVVGGMLLPSINGFIEGLTGLLQGMQDINPIFIQAGLAFAGVMAVIGPITTAIGALGVAFGAMATPIGLAVLAVAGLGLALSGAIDFEQVWTKVTTFGSTLLTKLSESVAAIEWTTLGQNIVDGLASSLTGLAEGIDNGTLGARLWSAIGAAIRGFQVGATWIWDNLLQPIAAGLAEVDMTALGEALQGFGSAILNGMLTGLGDLGTWAWDNIAQPILDGLSGMGAQMIDYFNDGIPDDISFEIPQRTFFKGVPGLESTFGPWPMSFDIADNPIAGGSRATGGYVSGGQQYLVGERGPEMFVPSGAGHIVKNSELGGGPTVNLSVYGQSPGDVLDMIQRELRNRSGR